MKRPLPILILDNSFSFGGSTQSLRYLLRALDRERFEPVLVTGQSPEFMAGHFDCTWYHYIPRLPWVNDRIYRRLADLPIFRSLWPRRVLVGLRFLYWIAFIHIPESFRYVRLGRKHGVALVHLNNILGTQLAGILAAKLLRVPCIAHLRDFERVNPVTRLYARLIDHHIAISGAIRDNLRELGVPEHKITVVHDALEIADFRSATHDALAGEFGLAPGQLSFGIFGRIVGWKGIREFILAARDVLAEIPEARAFVVGSHSDSDGDFFRSMQQLADELGLAGRLVFTGYRRDVPDLMGMMTVIVHASIRPEPFGMVIIEGMAMRKPVIATRGGGVLDIVVDGETGFLVDMGDAKAMADAITRLLRRQELCRAMGEAGFRRVAREFTSSRYAGQMATIYQHWGTTP
jgi:glycosyltransferase involved in cell wall biosynthesis